jgi:hypothetical protein
VSIGPGEYTIDKQRIVGREDVLLARCGNGVLYAS